MQERLQKMISKAGIASRRAAEQLIQAGRVKINNITVTELGVKVEPGKDRVTVDGKPISAEQYIYILLYKPKGVVTTLRDPKNRKTVADLVKNIPERIYPVGRLDYNTEGLLLLTNDGELTHVLIHPSRKIDKTYVAKVNGLPSEDKLDLLRAGIKLEDGLTSPAKIDLIENNPDTDTATIEITIHEGKNRQIRRMFDAIGHSIKNLKRVKFAFLTLKGVRRGQYRHLLPSEVEELKKMAQINFNKNPYSTN